MSLDYALWLLNDERKRIETWIACLYKKYRKEWEEREIELEEAIKILRKEK